MKKSLLLISILIFSLFEMTGQEAPPQAFSYKATIVNTKSGAVVASKSVSLRISIIQNDMQGITVYSELFNVMTNVYGQIDILIGKGNTLYGNFIDIPWSENIFFLKTEVDIKGGSDYQLMSLAQLLSVPYALFSEKSKTALTADYNTLYNKPTLLSQFTNDNGFLTRESDPLFSNHPVKGITIENISNWNSAFTWGDHKLARYARTDSVFTKWDLFTTGRSAVNWNNLTEKPKFASVALTGEYSDIKNSPLIPTSLTQISPDAGNRIITNVAEPVNMTDAATKAYVDALEKRLKSIEKALEKLDPYGIPVDADGYSYDTVKIGTQVWMKENLKTTRYQNGDSIPLVTGTEWGNLTTGAVCYYNNEYPYREMYGGLYNWYAVMDSRSICPTGWRVPAEGDWALLTEFLGGRLVAGGKLKETGSSQHWRTPNAGATDEYGFTALPGGTRSYTGVFGGAGSSANLWFARELNLTVAFTGGINYSSTYFNLVSNNKKTGMSVRCIKGTVEQKPLPVVATAEITGITGTSAVSGGTITDSQNAGVIKRGVISGSQPNLTVATAAQTSEGSGPGSYVSNLPGLQPARLYYVRAFAITNSGTAYGEEKSFTTLAGAPVISTTVVNLANITTNSAIVGGQVQYESGSPVSSRGICWSTNPNPSITDSKLTSGTGTGAFSVTITGLNPNTRYYFRAYAVNGIDVGYGNVQNFLTKMPAITVTTLPVSTITQTTAASGGNIINNSNLSITEQGLLWATSPLPIYGYSNYKISTVPGNFTLEMTGLALATTYYVRAYAKSNESIIYGDTISFITLKDSYVLTLPVDSILATYVIAGGRVSDATIKRKGMCWSTDPNPDTLDLKMDASYNPSLTFKCQLAVHPNTVYYTKAWAIINGAIRYGDEVSFKSDDGVVVLDSIRFVTVDQTSMTLISRMIDHGGSYISVKGFCWSTSPNATVQNNVINTVGGVSDINSTIPVFPAGNTYYIRAFATNQFGTFYSPEKCLRQ